MQGLIKKTRIPIKEMILIGFLPGFMKRLFYKFKGYKISKKTRIGFGSVIISEDVEIGKNVKIGYFTIIRARKLKIGDNVDIGSLCFIDSVLVDVGSNTRIREKVMAGGIITPKSSLIIGANCLIMQETMFNTSEEIFINDNTGIGGRCMIFTHSSWNSCLDGYPVQFNNVSIGKNVWIPWGVTVFPGVKIGDGAIISGGAVVGINVPENSIAAGNPAKIVARNFRFENKDKENTIIEIINSFIEHLRFFGYNVIEERNDKSETNYSISKKSYIGGVWVTENPQNAMTNLKKDNLIISKNISDIALPGVMGVDIENSIKSGNSKIGNEFVKFTSRYGIRF